MFNIAQFSAESEAQRSMKLARSWLVRELAAAGWKPEDLREGIARRVRDRLRREPSMLTKLAKLLESELGNTRLRDALLAFAGKQKDIDLDAINFVNPAAVGVLIHTAVAQLELVTLERAAQVVDILLADQRVVAVEEVPPLQFSLKDAEHYLPRIVAELNVTCSIVLGGDTDMKNFFDRLLTGLLTLKAAKAKLARERQQKATANKPAASRQAFKQR